MVSVRNNMENKVVYVDASETVMDASNKMLNNSVWSLVVLKGGLPEGVVTERDMIIRCLSKGLNPRTVSVEQIMSSPLITIGPEEPMRRAFEVMQEKNIRRVYVIENGKIIGRVTQTAACSSLLDLVSGLSSISNVI
jgi:CBS domain-containing protein